MSSLTLSCFSGWDREEKRFVAITTGKSSLEVKMAHEWWHWIFNLTVPFINPEAFSLSVKRTYNIWFHSECFCLFENRKIVNIKNLFNWNMDHNPSAPRDVVHNSPWHFLSLLAKVGVSVWLSIITACHYAHLYQLCSHTLRPGHRHLPVLTSCPFSILSSSTSTR